MSNWIPYEQYMENSDPEDLKIVNLNLSEIDKKEVSKMISLIEKDEGMNNYEKGALLENTIERILLGTKIFKSIKNKHTTSNEFDLLVTLNLNGKYMRAMKLIPQWIPDEFLIECKNHTKPVDVGLVGKFYSLMDVSNISLGIFIAKYGVSGRDKKLWEDAAAFINKINLKYSESSSQRILLDFSLNEIKRVLENDVNMVDLIYDKKVQINLDISGELSRWILPHENAIEIEKNR